MGTLLGIGLLLALSVEAYAQRRGFGGQLPGLGRSASVNTMPPARLRPQIPTGGAGGRTPLDSHGSVSGFSSGFSNDAVVPYVVPYPVYGGGGAYPDPGDAPSGSDTEIPDTPQPPALAAPPVQYYAVPRRPEPPPSESTSRSAPACQDSGDKINPAQFFIALKNSWVYTALAYWVQGETLHYISSQGGHNMVSLDLVDREISAKLNRGARVEFALPQR
jgi:hypothetical protein